MTKQRFKEIWEKNKVRILIGVGAATTVGFAILAYTKCKKYGEIPKINLEEFLGTVRFKANPSREIPETEGFKILDIKEDIDDGCVVWLDGCKLSDCGALGEGLCKIDRVNPETMSTMVILAKEKLDIFEK